MNEKWFDECSLVAYPHEVRFLHIDGGSISYCVDKHVSEYIGKIQAQLNTLQNENRDKNIKNMILQSKIDKSDELIETYKKERDTYKRLAEEYINKYNKEKEKNKRVINRISIVRMDNDITMETNRVLDYILKSLIGE